MSYEPVYRDGRLHVMAEKCSTCVFRPGNPMQLNPGRLADLVEANLAEDAALVCHHTTYGQGDPAVCRGFFDAYGGRVTALRLAGVVGVLDFDGVESPSDVRTV